MMRINDKNTRWQDSPWSVALLFVLLIGPFALDFHMHYPDEMYYSDAAVRMTQSGDYLTTYLGSGELRFNKPILTYWGVLAGFELFGISAFSSRVFFLLAGAWTIILVYKIGEVTFGDRKIAVLASLITASHPVLIFSSTRSIPDILLALFITLSALGFAGLLRHGDQAAKKYLWMLYLGLGLAFQVKGLPALAIGGIGILYLLLNPWQRIGLKKLLYLPAVLLGLFIAVFWFVSMYLKFGATYLDSFYTDQVGIRVSDQMFTILINLMLAVILMVGMFFPWAFLGFKNFKGEVKKLIAQNRAFFWWVAVWVISIILMSAMVTKFYERYLLPVTPLAAVGLAWLLSQNASLARARAVAVFLYFFFALNIVVLLAALFLNVGMDAAWFIYPGLLLGIFALTVLFINIKERRNAFFWLGISIMLIFYNLAFITYQISLPHQGKQVAEFVEQNPIPKGSRIAFIGHLHTGSKIRIGLGKDYYMTDLPKEGYQGQLEQYDYIICDEEIKNQLDVEMFDVETASITWDLKLIPEMMRNILAGTYREMLLETGKRYYWVERK